MLHDAFQDAYKQLQESNSKDREKVLNDALIKNGFTQGETWPRDSMFPYVMCRKSGEWSIYFANNGTPDGKFIVAIQDPKIEFDNGVIRTTTNFTEDETLFVTKK